jgi:hypothetical protein
MRARAIERLHQAAGLIVCMFKFCGRLSGYPLLVLAAELYLRDTARKYPSNLHTTLTYACSGCGLFAAIRGAGVPHVIW